MKDTEKLLARPLPSEQKTVSIKGAQHLVWHLTLQKAESSHRPAAHRVGQCVCLFVCSPRVAESPCGRHCAGPPLTQAKIDAAGLPLRAVMNNLYC